MKSRSRDGLAAKSLLAVVQHQNYFNTISVMIGQIYNLTFYRYSPRYVPVSKSIDKNRPIFSLKE